MPEMIATGLREYRGRKLSEGERFHVERRHVRTLVVTRKARLAEHVEDASVYETRDMQAGDAGEYETREMEPAKRGRGRPRKVPVA